jgi:hypothetical protein
MSDNDGGPAFGYGDPTHGGEPGMTLRDYHEGQALTGLLAAGFGTEDMPEKKALIHIDQVVAASRKLADAMLAEREGGTE